MSTSPDEKEKSLLETSHTVEDVSSYPTSSYSKKKQILATVFATLGCLLNGAAIGFTGGMSEISFLVLCLPATYKNCKAVIRFTPPFFRALCSKEKIL